MLNYHFPSGINPQISKYVKVLVHFTIFYFVLLILSMPLIFMKLLRIIVSLRIRLFHKGRYTLLSPADVLVCSNIIPDAMNLNFVMFVNDNCDLNQLRTRILTNISASDKDYNIPYKVLFHAIVTKFGFYCYEDKRKSFDINHHVRICPKVENTQQVYTESEMFSMIEATAAQEWNDDRPPWEMLLIPKIKKDETGKVCSAIAINISHGCADGISLANFIKNCVMDQPSPKLLVDPVNPPLPKVNLLQKILLYIKVFFIGPHIFFTNSEFSKEQLMHEKGLLMDGSSKFLGRTKLQLSLEMMKQIRKTFNCSTQAVFHSAFLGAMKKITKRKKYPITPEVLGALPVAQFPYPNEYPQNRAFLTTDLMPTGIQDPIARLEKINTKLRKITSSEVVLTNLLFVRLIAQLPAPVFHAIFSTIFKLAYIISNVPGIMGSATLFGKDIPLIVGVGPLCHELRAGLGLSCYNGIFSAVFMVEKSELFNTREDLDELIKEFETELKYYLNVKSA